MFSFPVFSSAKLSLIVLLSATLFSAKAQDVPSQAIDISPLLIGETAPNTAVEDINGKVVKLHDLITTSPTVLIFYRGGFCPYCNTQLSDMQGIEQQIIQLGYQIIAVSPDAPGGLKESVQEQKLSYRLLSDSQLRLAQDFGVAFEAPSGYKDLLLSRSQGKNSHALLPVPAVFVLNTEGLIQFQFVSPNYKVRFKANTLLAVLNTL